MELLIDGDVIVYRIGFATQKTVREVWSKDGVPDRWGGEPLESFTNKADMDKWVKDNPTIEVELVSRLEADPLAYALHSVKVYINGMIKDTGADSYRLFLTGKDNFRLQVDSEYKANRKDTAKPIHYQAIRDYMVKHFKAEVIEGMEADDALALNQTDNTMIASIDKDLLMVEGEHYNFVKKEFTHVTYEAGIHWFYMQMLMGDKVDNIIGIRGIGAVKAAKILAESKDWDAAVESRYQDEFGEGWYQRMVQNTQLLWMLQKDVKMPMDIKGDIDIADN